MHTAIAAVTPTPPPGPPDPGDTDDTVVTVSVSRASTSSSTTRPVATRTASVTVTKENAPELTAKTHSSSEHRRQPRQEPMSQHHTPATNQIQTDLQESDKQSPKKSQPQVQGEESVSSRRDEPASSAQPTSVKISVSVPRDAVGFIIGKRGETVRNMMTKSGAFVAVDREDTNPHAPFRLFHIEGEKSAVTAARALIKEKVAAVLHGKPHARVIDAKLHTQAHASAQVGGQSAEVLGLDTDDVDDDAPLSEPLEMWIPRGCVGMIIGHGGQVINEMQERAGATIVVHNNRMDRNGSKLLTISGGEAEKQHAQELIQNILDRAGLRNRFNDNPSQHHDPHWGLIHSQALQGHPGPPWFVPGGGHQLAFDPRGQVPDLLRYPHAIPQWMHPLTMHPRHQQPVPGIVAQPQLSQGQTQPSPSQNQAQQQTQQATSPSSPTSTQQQHLQQQIHQQLQQQLQLQHQHSKQQQQQPQNQQQPDQQQQQQQPQQHVQQHPQQHLQQHLQQPQSQQSQAQLHAQTPPQQQAQSPQIPRAPGMAGTHLAPHVNPIYGRPVNPSAQPMPWNPAQMPYPVGQNMPVPFDQSNMMSPHPMVEYATKAVCVPSSCVGIVIGRSGETIRDLQQRSGAHIKVTPDRDAKDDDPLRVIYISGTPAALELAHTLVNDVINEGLTRSYRDGVEPRSGTDQTDLSTQGNQTDQDPSNGAKDPSGGVPLTDGNENSKNHPGVDSRISNVEDHVPSKDVGDTIDYTDSTKFPELSAANRDVKSKRAAETAKIPREEASEPKANDQSWSGEQGETVEQGQAEGHGVKDAEPSPTHFTGEGRLVQRPATSYPSPSISFEMKIPHAKVGVIIGKRGSTIRLLQQKSGARIVVSKRIDTSREDNPRAVTITGPEPFVETARRLIIAKISDPRADDKDLSVDPLDIDETFLSEDAGVDSLTMDMANHSINSPLPHMIPPSPSPISPMRMAQTPSYGHYHRPVPMVTPNPPIQFSGVPQYPNMRNMMRPEAPDFRPLEPQGHQQGQFPPHFMGVQQFTERMHVAQGFPFPQSAEAGDSLQPGYGEYRPEQFYPHTGGNFVGLPTDGATNFQVDPAAQVGQSSAGPIPSEYTGDEPVYSYEVDEYDRQDTDTASAP